MYSKKNDFFDTPEGKEIEATLYIISNSEDYITGSSYSPNTDVYENNSVSFIQKHMAYIRSHPQVNAEHYVSNLKLMSRKIR